jgi:hypothetical protein
MIAWIARNGRLAAVLVVLTLAAVGVALAAPPTEAAKPAPVFTGTASASVVGGRCVYAYAFASDGHGVGIVEVLWGLEGSGPSGWAQTPLRVHLSDPITGSLAAAAAPAGASVWFRIQLIDRQGAVLATAGTTPPAVSCPPA